MPASPTAYERPQERRAGPDGSHDRREHSSHDGYRRKKREGFLSDLFDF